MRTSKYSREALEPIVKASRSLAEVMRRLGLRPTGGNFRHIAARVRRAELDTSHFAYGRSTDWVRAIPEATLRQLVSEARSFAQVLERLDMPTVGRPHATLKRRVAELGIDTSHFRGESWARGLSAKTNEALARGVRKRSFTDEQVFVENSPVYNGPALIRRLLARGWTYECAWCGLAEWRGQRLVLHLDHANGVHNDNRFENLRLLCPNCHSQTETYCNRRR
jgi:hypothetical protein